MFSGQCLPSIHCLNTIDYTIMAPYLSQKFLDNDNTILKTFHAGHISCEHHDDVIKWKHFPRYWPFVRGIHRSPVNSPHKGQWRGALMFTLICARINGWVNNREAGDLRRYRPYHDVIVMTLSISCEIMLARDHGVHKGLKGDRQRQFGALYPCFNDVYYHRL